MEEIFQTFLKASKDELIDAAKHLKENAPAVMNTMLVKQPRAEALQKIIQRKNIVTKDVPPTTPGIVFTETQEEILRKANFFQVKVIIFFLFY